MDIAQFEPELAAQEVEGPVSFDKTLGWPSVTLSLLDPTIECSETRGVEAPDDAAEVLSLMSMRSIKRDIVAIPALTSLLTSEPMSDIVAPREKNFSFHPLVLLLIDSLYLITKR